MDQSFAGSIFLFGLCVVLSAYFSSSETAFTSVSSIRLQNQADNGDRKAQQALHLLDNFESLLSTILIGNNIVNIAASAIATVVLLVWFPRYGATLSTIVTTVVLLLFSEITPKLIAKMVPEQFAKFSAPILRLFMVIMTPIVWLINGWQRMIQHIIPLESDDSISEDELLSLVDEARSGGSIEYDEQRLVKAAINFDDRTVSSTLTPRVDVEAVDINDSDDTIDQSFLTHPYSRLVVYDDTIDNVVGVLHERDFNRYLRAKHNNKSVILPSIVSDVLFIHPTIKLADLLRQMQKQKIHMAVVRDEHGGVNGIVTMEDVLEELVGEIWDEDDVVSTDIKELSPGNHYQFNGVCSIEKALPLLGIPLEEPQIYRTVNGFVINQLGKLPATGDQFSTKGWTFQVLSEDKQRVSLLDAKRLDYESDEDVDQ
ncbi:HlyC/CorC family transporter [Aerococcus kribbianus]|uniref:Hemolysin family protein n=1 Tax=Aerococcus kribbianus TaxID=2999064 RepID=A0A9X3FP06_9LACT|nr:MULTISPECIES: hemolysin family protein [unclassified Aerococcus]MCZ0717058.1 hemolysin family protein [Aerococcus sp. YH-aer221]MCZ0725346.1 hemolysin family protein [Aerococcus sp. YH-aer222]